MAARESVQFDFLSHGATQLAGDFKKTGDSAALAAKGARLLADSLDKQRRATDASAGAALSLAKADKILADAEHVLRDGALEAEFALKKQGEQARQTAEETAAAAGAADAAGAGFTGLGGGLGAVAAAGVALSPVIATVGVGLGGLALAALATGKHSKELAADLAPLKADFAGFQKELQPVVLTDFAKAAGVASTLLRGVEPVAAATGKALGGVFTELGAELGSPEWRQFFQFMATTAGPDVRMLGTDIVGLTKALPPLLEGLQPIANAVLTDTNAITGLILKVEGLSHEAGQLATVHKNTAQQTNVLADAAKNAVSFMAPEAKWAATLAHYLAGTAQQAAAAGKGLGSTALGAIKAHAPVFNLDKAVAALNTDMTTLVGNLLTLQGDNVAWRQSMEAAKKQLDSNTAGLAGNSKNALANKQAIVASTNAAIQFASEQLTLHKNIAGASDTIQGQIRFLQGLHDKSAFVKAELKALREEEARLNRQRINQTVNVRGLGQWSVSQSLAPGAGHRRAMGGLIPGSGSSDNYPALLTPGEVVVPKGMVRAGAVDHLRGRLPGFAAGGLVPSFSGAVGGLGPWIKMNDTATIRLMDEAIARATTAGMRAAAAAAATGFGRGHPLSGAGVYSQPALEALWTSAGGPPALAHLMAAIADAESGGRPNAYNASGASGLWQILGQIVPGNIFNPFVNAENAVAKYRTQGLGAWVTYTSGAYKQYYDQGGLLMPGATLAINRTGRPEQVVPAGRGAGGGVNVTINVKVAPGAHPGEVGRQVAESLSEFFRRGGTMRKPRGW